MGNLCKCRTFNPRNPRVASFTSPPHWLGVWVVSWGTFGHLSSQTFGSFAYDHCEKPRSKRMEAMAIYFRCSQHEAFEAFRNFRGIDLGSVQKLDMICLEVQDHCLKTSSENRQFLRTGKAEAKALRDKEEVMRWHLSALVGKVIDPLWPCGVSMVSPVFTSFTWILS